MTTTRQFRCNLCKDFIAPTNDTPREGFGVHFHGGGGSQWLTLKRVSECENHICLKCATDVHDELRRVTPAKEPT